MKKVWTTPTGDYFTLYKDMLKQPRLLIAGATGSGKSVVINGLIYTALYDSPAAVQFIFIDPKRVELAEYKNLPHCIKYASEPGEMVQALETAMNLTESRYRDMQRAGVRKYPGGAVYVVIDELACSAAIATAYTNRTGGKRAYNSRHAMPACGGHSYPHQGQF